MNRLSLQDRFYKVTEAIGQACQRAGRKREEVELLAVSKFHPASAIAELLSLGQCHFGENYIQEWLAKKAALADLPDAHNICWDMIGHLQTRKAGLVAGEFNLIQTVDSSKLANALEKHLQADMGIQNILMEVNIAEEPQKSGVHPDEALRLAENLKENNPLLHLRGLMCMPPLCDDSEEVRPYFARLRKLRDRLEKEIGEALPVLSMGMSGDFTIAIEEGATIVRIGSALFGPRPKVAPII